jgi:hypothetical protein
VAKITGFLATVNVHPWIDLTFHEPVPERIDWLGKLLQEPIFGSERFKPGHRKRRNPYFLITGLWEAQALAIRLYGQDNRSRIPQNIDEKVHSDGHQSVAMECRGATKKGEKFSRSANIRL